jgi:hypothetical protein
MDVGDEFLIMRVPRLDGWRRTRVIHIGADLGRFACRRSFYEVESTAATGLFQFDCQCFGLRHRWRARGGGKVQALEPASPNAKEEALKMGMEEESCEFAEKGSELYPKRNFQAFCRRPKVIQNDS